MTGGALVFDFDGVLANSEPIHFIAFRELLASVGIPLTADEYYADYLGLPDEEAFVRALRAYRQDADPARVRELVARKSDRMRQLYEGDAVMFEAAIACVRRFAGVRPLAIASGALRAEIEILLDRAGLRGFFGAIVAAGETARSKPAPDPYVRALALLRESGAMAADVPPAACVAVEDSPRGLESARRAGLRCIAVTSSYPAEALEAADMVLSSLDALDGALVSRLLRGSR